MNASVAVADNYSLKTFYGYLSIVIGVMFTQMFIFGMLKTSNK